MQTKVEGLIISKIPYRERDLICKLLLRSGNKVSIIFFGGRGGGSKKRSTELELGHMVKVELRHSNKQTDLYNAKEWSLIWSHEKLRLDFKAFYLLCLYLELIAKISLIEDLKSDFNDDNKRIFQVLSNAIFYLEKSVSEGNFQQDTHLALFITQNMLAQGVYPNLSACSVCNGPIEEDFGVNLAPNHGGFICSECQFSELKQNIKHQFDGPSQKYEFLKIATGLNFKEFQHIKVPLECSNKDLLAYFCYQFNIELSDLKTLSFLF